jgi:hypothetical protein
MIKRLAGNGYRDRHHSQTAIRDYTNMPNKKQRRLLVTAFGRGRVKRHAMNA